MENTNLRRVLYAALILFMITTLGVFGFMIIEGDSFLDALYLTVITISTVGFGLTHDLSTSGKVFTIFLIIFSFGTYAYAISIITTYLVQLQINNVLGIRSRKNGRNMKDHVIICGFGRNGQKVAEELTVRNQPFVVIDQNHELIMNYNGDPVKFVEGDATEDDILIKAGVENARSIISSMPVDADNLFVVLSARALNKNITIISRASNKSAEKKLHVAGVDHVVLPEGVGGSHMAKLVTRGDILEFLDHLSITGPSETILEVINYDELPETCRDKTIKEMAVRERTGANIVGFKTPDKEYIINPVPATKIIPESMIFVLGTPEQIQKIKIQKK